MRGALLLPLSAIALAASCGAPASPAPPPARPPVAAPQARDAAAEPPPAVANDVDPGASIPDGGAPAAITGDSVEPAVPAKFGQSLAPGLYVFPDGLRIRVEQIANCDFDTSVPCFGGTYRAEASLGAQEARVEWSTRTAKVLRYSLTLSNFRFVVTK